MLIKNFEDKQHSCYYVTFFCVCHRSRTALGHSKEIVPSVKQVFKIIIHYMPKAMLHFNWPHIWPMTFLCKLTRIGHRLSYLLLNCCVTLTSICFTLSLRFFFFWSLRFLIIASYGSYSWHFLHYITFHCYNLLLGLQVLSHLPRTALGSGEISSSREILRFLFTPLWGYIHTTHNFLWNDCWFLSVHFEGSHLTVY